jgi:hypothetical protein
MAMNNTHLASRWLAVVCIAILCTGACAALAEDASESLGSQLLDDLDPDLFAPPAQRSVPKRILPDLPDDALGEDLGQPSAGGPLVRVKQNMETAQALIRQPALARAGQVQRQVVADLDALIEQLAKQCCSGACQSSDQPKPSSKRSQTAGAKPGAKAGRGSAPARDSNARLGRGDPKAVNLAEREALLKDLWGHLPPHVRERLLQAHSDEFLPQYELEIEKYFRRLAEDEDAPLSN